MQIFFGIFFSYKKCVFLHIFSKSDIFTHPTHWKSNCCPNYKWFNRQMLNSVSKVRFML